MHPPEPRRLRGRPSPPLADDAPDLEPGAAPPRLLVTTTKSTAPDLLARARVVAARCGAELASREASLDALLVERGAELAYVVGREVEWLYGPGRARLVVHRGMLDSRRDAGAIHPLVRALVPAGERPLTRVLDATLGLAQDAIHLADVLGVRIVGVEVSPALASLAEAGLARELTRGLEAAGRIEVVCGDAAEVLAALPGASVDVVYVDEMFARPRRSAPGFALLRRVAGHAPLGARFWEEAKRVAARRVVVKLPRDAVDPAAFAFDEVVIGQAMAYGIHHTGERSLAFAPAAKA